MTDRENEMFLYYRKIYSVSLGYERPRHPCEGIPVPLATQQHTSSRLLTTWCSQTYDRPWRWSCLRKVRMPSAGAARSVWWPSLPPSWTIHVFPLDGRLHHQVWWHILYTGGGKWEEEKVARRTKTSEAKGRDRAAKREREKEIERKMDRCSFLGSGVLIAWY